jgi:hypothetical protein
MTHIFQRLVFMQIGHLLNLDHAFARGTVHLSFGRSDGFAITMDVNVPLFYSEESTIAEVHEMAFDAAKRCLIDAAEFLKDSDLAKAKSMTNEFERNGPPALRPDVEEEANYESGQN